MATVKIFIRGKSNPSNLYVRFINGRKYDISTKTEILINPSHWDNSKSNYKNTKEVKDRLKKYSNFEKLKLHILSEFTEAFSSGDIIDKYWLKNTINRFFNRPKSLDGDNKLKKQDIYYIDFAKHWLDNDAKTWKTSSGKTLSKRVIQQYQSFLKMVLKFQGAKKLRIKDVNHALINDFITFLQEKEGYSYETVKRAIGRFRFFITRAKSKGLKVSSDYEENVYISRIKDEIIKPYLNEQEINKVYNLDVSDDEALDAIKDNFIIGLWTGLRIGDFNSNLDINNIKGEYIDIKTSKTGKWVSIPLHPHVKTIIKKRFGLLPPKTSDKDFNEKVKLICKYAEIDEEILGDLKDVKINRNKRGVYPKYKLISSHTCRRSFATNLFGVVPNYVIQSVGGWASEKMMLHYIKRTNKENAEILKQHFDNKYK